MKKGFTLVELLTSVAIFGFASAIVVGLLIYAINLQRAVIAQQKLLDEASFVMEYMARALKFAQKDDLGSCIDYGKNYKVENLVGSYKNAKITFLYPDPHSPDTTICRSFFLDESTLRLKENRYGVGEDFITSPSIEVRDIKFKVQGDAPYNQPRVTIMMVLKSKGTRPEEQSSIRLQTTVSQRDLNI